MTTRTTSAAAARRAAKEATESQRVAPPQLPAEIAERILGYRPKKIDPAVWDTVRLAVVEIVVRSEPSTPEHAQHRMLPMARLAAWAHGRGVSLDPATLLSERVVEEWARQALSTGESPKSVATYRSAMRAIAAAVMGPAVVKPTATISRTAGAVPHTSAEDLALRQAVTGQRTPVYRATGCLLYGLSRGAGLIATDLRSLRVGDVEDTAEGISVRLADRTVWVLDGFSAIVRMGLSVDRGDGWLLAGRDGQRRNIGGYIDRFTVPAGTPRLTLSRCRATWILDHLNRGTPITVIQDALGLAGLDAVERVLPYADDVDPDVRARLLRGTT